MLQAVPFLIFFGYYSYHAHYYIIGESPFSSVSDVDNLNNPTIVDKAASAKVVGSPQVAGTHVISARNGSSFTRLINLVSTHIFNDKPTPQLKKYFVIINTVIR